MEGIFLARCNGLISSARLGLIWRSVGLLPESSKVICCLGIIKGDEIMVINGAIVSDLDMMFIESVLQEEISLCMMMRSSRTGGRQNTLGMGMIETFFSSASRATRHERQLEVDRGHDRELGVSPTAQ